MSAPEDESPATRPAHDESRGSRRSRSKNRPMICVTACHMSSDNRVVPRRVVEDQAGRSVRPSPAINLTGHGLVEHGCFLVPRCRLTVQIARHGAIRAFWVPASLPGHREAGRWSETVVDRAVPAAPKPPAAVLTMRLRCFSEFGGRFGFALSPLHP